MSKRMIMALAISILVGYAALEWVNTHNQATRLGPAVEIAAERLAGDYTARPLVSVALTCGTGVTSVSREMDSPKAVTGAALIALVPSDCDMTAARVSGWHVVPPAFEGVTVPGFPSAQVTVIAAADSASVTVQAAVRLGLFGWRKVESTATATTQLPDSGPVDTALQAAVVQAVTTLAARVRPEVIEAPPQVQSVPVQATGGEAAAIPSPPSPVTVQSEPPNLAPPTPEQIFDMEFIKEYFKPVPATQGGNP